MNEFAYIVIGCLAGGGAAWWVASWRASARTRSELAEMSYRAKGAEERAIRIEAELRSSSDALSRERELRVRAETSLEGAELRLAEQASLIASMKNELSATFGSLAGAALKSNNEQFLTLAREAMKAATVEGQKELDGKKALIDQTLKQMGQSLEQVGKQVQDVSHRSQQRMNELSGQLEKHSEITSRLMSTADHLNRTLSGSKQRGQWGELITDDIIRLAGLIENVNYTRQKSLEHAAGIPDYTFFLPGGLKVNMDVKFPLNHYQGYLAAESDQDRKQQLDAMVKGARAMMRQIRSREYIDPANGTVDYAIMFVPNEQVYAFLNEADPALIEESLKQKVIVCSPFTLYAVLAVIRQSVENFNLERTSSEILELLGNFAKQWRMFKEKMQAMGDKLDAARKEYDALASTRTNMLERPLRKIEDIRKRQSLQIEDSLDVEDA